MVDSLLILLAEGHADDSGRSMHKEVLGDVM